MHPYLNFRGDCEAAFTFYEQCFGGKLGPVFRYSGTPLAHQVPPAWQEKVMHMSLELGGQSLMGADVAPERYEEPKGFSLSIQLSSTIDAERIFSELADRGVVVAPLEQTFWAARFGVVRDHFGITWLINCDGAAADTASRELENTQSLEVS